MVNYHFDGNNQHGLLRTIYAHNLDESRIQTNDHQIRTLSRDATLHLELCHLKQPVSPTMNDVPSFVSRDMSRYPPDSSSAMKASVGSVNPFKHHALFSYHTYTLTIALLYVKGLMTISLPFHLYPAVPTLLRAQLEHVLNDSE